MNTLKFGSSSLRIFMSHPFSNAHLLHSQEVDGTLTHCGIENLHCREEHTAVVSGFFRGCGNRGRLVGIVNIYIVNVNNKSDVSFTLREENSLTKSYSND